MTGKVVQLGVGAGAAVFKAVATASLLARAGLQVRVAMTQASLEFVRPLSFTAVTGQPVVTSATAIDPDGVASHLRDVDAFLVVPATADLLARLAHGQAADAVTLAALAAPDLRFFCPAMNDRMWENAFVQENVTRLENAGWHRIGPEVGRLAEGYAGAGRMSEPERIVEVILEALGEETG